MEAKVAKDTDETLPLTDPGACLHGDLNAPVENGETPYLEPEYPDDPMEKHLLEPKVSNHILKKHACIQQGSIYMYVQTPIFSPMGCKHQHIKLVVYINFLLVCVWWYSITLPKNISLPPGEYHSLLTLSLEVLTRRDQLKFKQNPGDDGEPEAVEPEDTEVLAEGAGKNTDDAPSKPASSGKGAGRAKAKAKAKAKSKAEAKPKAASSKAKAKAKSEPKAKAKRAAKSKAIPHEEDQEEIKTPEPDPADSTVADADDDVFGSSTKRKLFHDEDGQGEEPDTKDDLPDGPTFVDPKTGKQMSLREVFENYAPDAWRKKMRRGDMDERVPSVPAPKAGAKAKAKAKAKSKAKAKAKASAGKKAEITSPSIKKEQARRRRKTQHVMETNEEDLVDHEMQGVFMKTIKDVKNIKDEEDVKKYLKKFVGNTSWRYTFSAYWSRGTIGLMKKDGATYVYFNFGSPLGNWHMDIAVVYQCAGLVVSCL